MRILHVNKFLYRRGGAESYMLEVADLQRARGHQVDFFAMAHPANEASQHSADFPSYMELDPPPASAVGRARAAGRILYSREAERGMARVLERVRPDVVHMHNIYQHLSPSILRPIRRAGIASVMTLHDYKLACPTYQFLSHGAVCEACLGGHFRKAVSNACKGGSRSASAVLALELRLHTSLRMYGPVGRFIAPSRFLAQKMREAGVFPERLRVVAHFAQLDSVATKERAGGPVLFMGRLAPEKGVDTLIQAAALLPEGARLEIAGDGPERERLTAMAAELAPGRVTFLGRLDRERLLESVRASIAVCLPARWYENQPMSILEAFSCGVPVVGSTLGGIPELVHEGHTGMLVPPMILQRSPLR